MSDWVEDLAPEERAGWDEFVEHFRRDALEKISGAAAFVSLVPSQGWDVKFATELGAAIMMDKPLLVIVQPGSTVSAKLRAVADEVVEVDVDTEGGQQAITAAIKRMIG